LAGHLCVDKPGPAYDLGGKIDRGQRSLWLRSMNWPNACPNRTHYTRLLEGKGAFTPVRAGRQCDGSSTR
jgi:hypothetical protein